MLFVVAIGGVAIVWLMFFAPDGVPEGLRKGLIVAAVVTTLGSAWGAHALMTSMNEARMRSQSQAAEAERKKTEAIRQLQEPAEGTLQPEKYHPLPR